MDIPYSLSRWFPKTREQASCCFPSRIPSKRTGWQKKRLRTLRIFPALLFCIPLHASFAEVVYHTGFEEAESFGGSYAVGPLVGQGEHLPEISPWLQPQGEENSGAEIVGESRSRQLPPPQGDQMLQLQYVSGNPAIFQNFLPEARALKQDFKATFLLGVDGEVSNGTFYFAVQSSSGRNNGAWFGIRRLSAEPPSFGSFYKTTDSEGKMVWEKLGDIPLEPRQFYKITLEIDDSDQTFGGSVTDPEGRKILTFSHLPLLDQDGHMRNGRGFNRIYVGSDQIGNKPLFLVDDITIETIDK